jgi:hypothetical protein
MTDTREAGRSFTGSAIEVYTGTSSARAGDRVTIHVSTSAREYDLRVERFGAEPSVVWSREGLPGEFHPTPEDAWSEGCGWPAAVEIEVPDTWRSGYYEVIATARGEDGLEEYYAFFVVRAVTPASPILFVLSTSTYAAYNFYGGQSLYQAPGTAHLKKYVSNLRPWLPGWLRKPANYDLHTESLWPSMGNDPLWLTPVSRVPWLSCATGFANWERVMVEWLERNGYEVDYAVSSDLDLHPDLLPGYRLLVSVGHDEYWSWGMRDAVEGFVGAGGNVCFFSGNVSSGQVRFENDGATVVHYRDDYHDDPVYRSGDTRRATTLWSNHEVDRPENLMTGSSWLYAGFSRFHSIAHNGPRGFLVYRPEHWIFEGTKVGYGDCIGQNGIILRYEIDGCPIRFEKGLPYPTDWYVSPDPSLEIIGLAPAAHEPNDYAPRTLAEQLEFVGVTDPTLIDYIADNHGHATITMYERNGTVFTAGTTDWTNGLKGDDPEIEQITRNLLDRLSV